MANITLRSCFQKINSLVENGEVEKAEELSLYVISLFPKSYFAFQCLSKTLLQKQDLIQAERAFDIVLQIFPDDFVSHIGKSMIAESVGRLDDAIHHMRLAFEVEPSNEGLQNELKRLYTAKDGFESGKVQLTRGGLIRMYMKGGLYSQAAAEARIGLSENPEKITHKLALAKSLFEVKDFLKAAEVCIEIFGQLPYCWLANEIMNSITEGHFSSKQENIFKKRLIEMDPYYAYWTPAVKTVYDIPDIAVMIEDYQPGFEKRYGLNEVFENVDFSGRNDNQRTVEEISNMDWEAVISKAIKQPTVFTNDIINESISDKVSVITEEPEMAANRKQLLRDRLRAPKKSSIQDATIQDWYFSEERLSDPQISGNQLDNKTKTVFSDAIKDQADESGVYDTNVERNENEISPVHQSKDGWVKEEETIIQSSDSNVETPEDTQPIFINKKQNISELMSESLKAFSGGNRKYAVEKIRSAVNNDDKWDELIPLLEDAANFHPEFFELYSLLAEAYQKSGKKDKALETYKKIQNSIQILRES